jgi:2-aminoadipate transaminase
LDFSKIRLNKAAAEPLYLQLANELKAAVVRGDLADGEKLPPIRAWKDRLGISPVTATQAYERLATEGFTTGQVGRGTFIKYNSPRPAEPPPILREQATFYAPQTGLSWGGHIIARRHARLGQILQAAHNRYTSALNPPPDFINLTSGAPAPELFALKRWRTAMARAGESFEMTQEQLGYVPELGYSSATGDPATRTWLAEYVRRFGVNCNTDDILLTTGSQQGLDLIGRTLLQPGEGLLVESPCYVSGMDVFENLGMNLLPVPVDDAGMITDGLERQIERYRPKMIYVVPTAHSPTGATLSVARRAALLELARRYNLLIIEDDTCNEFFYEGESAPPSLYGQNAEGRVIYLKSFSKQIFPGVRFGAIVANGVVLARLTEAKAIFDRNSSVPLARAVLKFADSPAFERELQIARQTYHERRDALTDAVRSELGEFGVRVSRCEGGFSLMGILPSGGNAAELALEAGERGVGIVPGATIFYPMTENAPINTFRMTFGDNSPEKLREAAFRLREALIATQKVRPLTAVSTSFVAAV